MSAKISSVTVFHGFGCTPNGMWFPWIHKKLEAEAFPSVVPALPDPLNPTMSKWVRYATPVALKWNETSVVIGHSIGGVLALRLLEHVAKKPIFGLILVAPPFASFVSVKQMERAFAFPIDWAKLRARAKHIVLIQSKNDPVVPYDHGYRYREALGAKLVQTKDDGHFIGKTAPPVWRVFEKMIQ